MILTSVFVPIEAMIYILSSLAIGQQRRYILAIVLAIFLLPFATDALTWGSFLFNIDNSGMHRLRIIRFIPWSEGKFGEY